MPPEFTRMTALRLANGTPIGPNDLWIAAYARSLDLIAVTGNDRKFSHVPDLRVENWLRGDGS